jgi:uncharacterized membrane protein
MHTQEVFVFIFCLLGLFGILAIAIGIVVAVLIGEGEVKLIDTAVLLKDTKIPLGADKNYE